MIEYFEKRAGEYRERSARGLWSQFRRLEFATVCEMLAPRAGEHVLEFGCGAGFYTLLLREKFALEICAVDSSPSMLCEVAAAGIETWLGLAEDFPETGRRFDAVLAAGMFEFVERPAPVFLKAARVLSAGGKFVLLVPVAGWRGELYRRAHEWQGCPVFIREVEEYQRVASACGFELHRRHECTPISVALEFRRRPS